MGAPKLNLTLLPGENKKNPKGKKQTTAEQIAAVFSQYPEINEPTFDDETDRKLGVIYNELSKENSRRKEQMLNDFLELFNKNSDVLLRFSGDNEERQRVRKILIDKLCETLERLPKLEELAMKLPQLVKGEGTGEEKPESEEDIKNQQMSLIQVLTSTDEANRELAKTLEEHVQIPMGPLVETISSMIISENSAQLERAMMIMNERVELQEVMKSLYKQLLNKVKNNQETKKELLFFYHGSRELTEFKFSTKEELESVKKQRNLIEDCERLYPGMVQKGYPDHKNDAKRIAHAMLEVKNPRKSREKINAITFNKDTIEIAGLKWEREDFKRESIKRKTKIETKKSNGVTIKVRESEDGETFEYVEVEGHPEYQGQQLHKRGLGDDLRTESNGDHPERPGIPKGKKVPTDQQREDTLQAMPGGDGQQKYVNLKDLLDIRLLGWRDLSGYFGGMYDEADVRSSSVHSTYSARLREFRTDKGHRSYDSKTHAFSVRLVQD